MTPSIPDIAAALDAVEADPFVEPPRGRGRRVGADGLLEHRVACIAYAPTLDELARAARAAFRDYPQKSPGLTRIVYGALRLHPLRPTRDDAVRWWVTRAETIPAAGSRPATGRPSRAGAMTETIPPERAA